MGLRGFRRYPKQAYAFIFASFVNSVGSAFLWPLTTIYVHTVLHRSYGEAGFVLLMQALAGVIGQWFGGALYYRFGVRVLLIGSLVLSGAMQFGIAIFTNWNIYLALMTLMGFLVAVSMPVINAFIAFRWPEHRASLFNTVYVSNNLGVAVGTSVGGLLASASFALSFSVDGLTTLLFAVFFWFFFQGVESDEVGHLSLASGHSDTPEQSHRVLLLNYKVYLFVGLGAMLTWFSTSAYGSGIAPYLTDLGFSPATYSFLWTVNGIVIVLGQPVLAVLQRLAAKTLTKRLIASAVCYLTGFLWIELFHHVYYHLIIGMIVTTFGEMLISPTVPAYLTETTGSAAPYYLGVVGAVTNIGRMLGPFVYGHVYDKVGITPVMGITLTSMIVALILFAVQHRWSNTFKPIFADATSLAAARDQT